MVAIIPNMQTSSDKIRRFLAIFNISMLCMPAYKDTHTLKCAEDGPGLMVQDMVSPVNVATLPVRQTCCATDTR
jgi:hypothetical protein